MIRYRGYTADVSHHPTSGLLVGVLVGIPDQITFRGESVDDLALAMCRAVDDYIDFCLEWGRPTEPGRARDLTVQVSEELRQLAS